MAKLILTVEADNPSELAGIVDALDTYMNEAKRIAFPDYEDGANPGELAPDPAPEATVAAPRKSRAAKPPAKPEPAPAPQAPEPPPPSARELPSIEALKAMVTQAVRKAQKKEGPTKILDLLPDFKTKTGLGFVMEAEDKHKEALADLIEAAGLTEAAV